MSAYDEEIGVLLSGGVDSSVALLRLKSAGYRNITAYYLKIWLEDELSSLGECPWEEDLEYARAVCDMLEVPLTVVSLQLEYYERVVEYTLSELRAGRTPSPDIFCNQRIKFGAFLERVGADVPWVASGHYARVIDAAGGAGAPTDGPGAPGVSGRDPGAPAAAGALGPGRGAPAAEREYHLYRAPDPVKDQSYFLSHLTQGQLSRILFPIGGLEKREVRELADSAELPNRVRPDSQGICFLGKIRYPDFVRHYLGEREGNIVDRETGRTLGSHRGFWFYTLGQRQGLGLSGGPWYVTGKDLDANVVFVSHREHVSERAVNVVTLTDMHWIGTPPVLDEPRDGAAAGNEPPADEANRRLTVKLRHGPKRIACSIEPGEPGEQMEGGEPQSADDAAAKNINLRLEETDRGAAPGQFGVLYVGERCVGAGRIAAGARAEVRESAGKGVYA